MQRLCVNARRRRMIWLLLAVTGSMWQSAYALEPGEILVVANKDLAASVRLAKYYCRQRSVPAENIVYVSLGTRLEEKISRSDYEEWLAGPVRKELMRRLPGQIRCLLLTYGIPLKVGPRGRIIAMDHRLEELKQQIAREKARVDELQQTGQSIGPEVSVELEQRRRRIAQMQSEIDWIAGKETSASVDSELSMVLAGVYELYRWQPNPLRSGNWAMIFNTIMVSRLDGPSYAIAKGLVDKAISAEKRGLRGVAYIDSRGLRGMDLASRYDRSLRELAELTRLVTAMPVREERTERLFKAGQCPDAAIYCGWYSLGKYIDAFDFVEGAVGFHIASIEADRLRDPDSTRWCSAMLRDGITATLGAVEEPYLHAFPDPKSFFAELYKGRCLVEAFYLTKPFNSWRLVLIGDPLYRPFGRGYSAGSKDRPGLSGKGR